MAESVEFICSDASKMCGSLQNIALGGSLTLISSETVEECESLTSITIPASAGFFGAAAFKVVGEHLNLWAVDSHFKSYFPRM